MNAYQFFQEHFEGIIALFLGGIIPLLIWFFGFYKGQILDEAENQLNKVSKRIDVEISLIKEKLSILREKFIHLEEKQEYTAEDLKKDLEIISHELETLESLKQELQGTRELMLLQNTSIKQQIEDFKDFIKTHLLR